jgi:hypothetical protein
MNVFSKDEAIDRVGKALIARQNYRGENWRESYPQFVDEAEKLVVALVALDLIKLA